MKGQYGGSCNITACQKENSAFWFNHFNQQHYCEECAYRLNNDEFNKRSALNKLGHDMCTRIVENNVEMRESVTYPVAVVGHGKSNLDYELYKASQYEPPMIVGQEKIEKGIAMKEYFQTLLGSEEMNYYLDNFGFKKNPTTEKIKSWTKQQLLKEIKVIENKSSTLSKRERDLVIYFAQKIK